MQPVDQIEPESVIIDLEDHPAEIESIIVEKLPKRRNRYRVLSIPFWAYNLSLGDVVDCHSDEDGVGKIIGNVIEKSGNRTVRVGFKVKLGVKHEEARKLERYFKRQKLAYEAASNLFSVNVPTEAAYRKLVTRIGRIGEYAQMEWEDGDPQPEARTGGADTERYRVR